MKKVVIVEDEKLVLLGIESLFEGSTGYSVVGGFSRGVTALEQIPHLNPDIIITDIKMPGIDGLQLIKQIQEAGVRAKIVVLSCLEDFAIVSQAFKLGAVDYLLKHQLERDELFKTLDAIEIKGEHTQWRWEDQSRYSQQLAHNKEIASSFVFPLSYLVILKKHYSEEHLPLPTGVDTAWVYRFVWDLLKQHSLGKVFYEESNKLVLLIEGSVEAVDKRNLFFQQLVKQLTQFITSPIVIIREKGAINLSLEEQFKSLQKISSRVFYINTTKVVVTESAATPFAVKKISLAEPELLLKNHSVTQWEEEMKNYFAYCSKIMIDSSLLSTKLILYWHKVQQLFSLIFGDVSKDDTPLFEYLKEFDDITQLQLWFTTKLLEQAKEIQDVTAHSKKIVEMKLYLLKHYNEKITLEQMAQRLNINPNYLSELFKRESNIGFVEYVNRIRIDKAKELLQKSDLTVEQISEQVGFASPSYFSRLFKRVVGKTISEYRLTPSLP